MNLIITEFPNRKVSVGTVTPISWASLKARLKDPVVTNDVVDEYVNMTNEQRTEIKDVGGYVGGELEDGKRSKATLKNRYLLTVDADDATPDDVDNFLVAHPSTIFFCHTTHTSTKTAPRLRWIFPLSRPVTGDEYRVLVGIIKYWVGADSIDESTDQPERLMFWPSVALDGDYQYWDNGTVAISPDELLADIEIPITVAASSKPREETNDDNFIIAEGRRNRTVFGFAATLRGTGLSYNDIRTMLDTYNDNHCDPPLPSFELDAICRSVCGRYSAGDHVAPTMRDAWDDFNDLGEWKEPEKTKPTELSLESFSSLVKRNIAPPKYVVEGMITTGITIMASPPKFGKSWLCMDMGQCVAAGENFMGMKTEKSGVIYLALEDGDYRLKDRGLKVAGDRGIPEELYLVEDAPALNDGLLAMLQRAIASVGGNVGMVIIDTLQKIRGVASKTEGVYGYDYRELGALHKFALDNNIAIVLVHHLNKGSDDSDFVNRLNGSTGISGAADTIITLTRSKRKDKETRMDIVGRDVVERTLVLQMNWDTYRWMCLGDAKDVDENRDEIEFMGDPIVRTIVYHLDEAEDLLRTDNQAETATWRVSSKGLVEEVERWAGEYIESPAWVGRRIKQLESDLLTKLGISYRYERTSSARDHVFSREIV